MDVECIEYNLMPINSRAKGARFERYLALWFRDEGWADAKRGCQHAGRDVNTGQDAPDLIVPGLTEWLHIEAKHVERLQLQDVACEPNRVGSCAEACLGYKPSAIVSYRFHSYRVSVLAFRLPVRRLAVLLPMHAPCPQRSSRPDRL